MPRNTEMNAFRKDAITSSVAEINKLDGFTGTSTDLNRLIGMTYGQNSNNSFIPNLQQRVATRTAGSYTITKTDINTAIVCDSTAGNVTLNFPTDITSSGDLPLDGQIFVILNVGTANNIICPNTAKSVGNILWNALGDDGNTIVGSSLYIRPGGTALLLTYSSPSPNFVVIGQGIYKAAS